MIKRIIAALAASSIAVSAAPIAALAVEPEKNPAEVIVSAEDESFKAAAEELGGIAEQADEESGEEPEEAGETAEEPEETETAEEPEEEVELELFTDETAEQSVSLEERSVSFHDGYDIVKIDNDHDDGAYSGAPDGSNYKVSDGTATIWNTSEDLTLSSNYYLSVDFKLAEDTDANQIIMKNRNNNVGPQFSVSGTDFRTQTGGKNYSTLYGSYDVSRWYKLELEGRMSVVGAVTSFTLYEYGDDGTAVQVAHSDTLNLRNFSRSSGQTYGFTLLAEGVCYDNEYAVQEYPNSVVITESEGRGSVTGGDMLTFTAAAHRDGTEDSNLTQPKITWSLSGVAEGEEEYVRLMDGVLFVSALASEQTVTVTAAAESNGEPSADYPVQIVKRDLSGAKFDRVEVTGPAAIDAGSSGAYSFKAYKDGADVTETVTDEEIVWSIVNSNGTRQLGNRYITVENGTVSADKSVIGQDIRVRAASEDGYVYGEADITVNNSSSETVIHYSAGEENITDDMALVEQGSWDGSSYYVTNTSGDVLTSGSLGNTTTGGDVLISADLRFMEETGSGITTVRRDGGSGLHICSHDGVLAAQIGSSKYNDLGYALDPEAWYHLEVMFNTSGSSLNIWKYDESGSMTDKATFTPEDGLVLRNNNGFNRITLNSDTGLDNYRVVYPDPTDLSITGGVSTLGAGSSAEFGISGSRDGLAMPGLAMSAVNWSVYDGDGEGALPLAGNDVTVTAGVLSTYGLTSPQTVYVRATSVKDSGIYASAPVTITAADQFRITNIGYDAEDDRHLVRIYADKLTDYSEDVVFIMTFYDAQNSLIGSYTRNANAKNMREGENEIAVDYMLPETFDKATGTAKVMAWTSMSTSEEPEGVSGEFKAEYEGGSVVFTNLPEVTGKLTVAAYMPGVSDSELSGDTGAKIAYISQSDTAVPSVSVPGLEPGTYVAAVGGIQTDGAYSVYRAEFTVE